VGAGEAILALAAVLLAASVEVAAWRLRATLGALLALAGLAGALGSTAMRLTGGIDDAGPPLLVSAAFIAMAAGLLAIGRLFDRLLGREPD